MITIGLVGCGFMGRMHGQVYGVLEGARLAATIDLDRAAAEAIALPHNARASTEFEALLGDPSIDLIDICLPTFLHAEYTVAALEAGKHVVCEKPMALGLEEADRMIGAARASGRTLMIAHCIRVWPEYAILKRLVESGELGRLLSINMTRFGAFPSWSWDNWLADEGRSGGGALDMHVHDTDFALHLMGTPDTVSSWGTTDERGTSQIFSTMTWGDTIGHLQGGWNLPAGAPFRMAYRAIFEKGLANFDGGVLTIYEEGREPVAPDVPRMASAGGGGNISDLGGYYFELEYLVRCLADGRPVDLISPESSRESLELALEEIRQAKDRNRVLQCI